MGGGILAPFRPLVELSEGVGEVGQVVAFGAQTAESDIVGMDSERLEGICEGHWGELQVEG